MIFLGFERHKTRHLRVEEVKLIHVTCSETGHDNVTTFLAPTFSSTCLVRVGSRLESEAPKPRNFRYSIGTMCVNKVYRFTLSVIHQPFSS